MSDVTATMRRVVDDNGGLWHPSVGDVEPPRSFPDVGQVLHGQLELHRGRVVRKAQGLSDEQLRRPVLPSGWSVLELLVHLRAVERRWLEWGFLARPVVDPWCDDGEDGRWRVPDGWSAGDVVAALERQWDVSRQVVAGVPMERRSAVGGRFVTDEEAPTLGWALLHLLQETARHVGHLDAARELLDGEVGE